MNQFEKMGIDEDFNPFYKEAGIKTPTEVQTKAIAAIMNNESLLCVSQTGTGKTLAYALPVSELVKRLEDENGLSQKKSSPIAVIVSPTKELAVQIHGVFKKLSHHVKLRVRTNVGTPKVSADLKNQSYEILIATPTKLKRALKRGEVSFECLKFLVFDEADQLFEMGFQREIEGVMRHVEYAQTNINFFSATLPDEIEKFIDTKFEKKDLKKVILSSAHRVQKRIETFNIFVTVEEKQRMLKYFLEKTARGRGIVFVNQKNQVDEINEFLKEQMPKLRYKALHGGMAQKDRLDNLKSFVDKKAQVLLATDVAARGIDIKDLAWVFNFGLPKTSIYYLHRCGRTGRNGNSGVVYNLVTGFDAKIISQINEAITKQSTLDIPLIAKDIKSVKKTKTTTKVKTKRVKVTKRTRL